MAGVNCSAVHLTQHKTITRNSKANIMATKKNVKVRDLKPSKDAKGGGASVNRGHAVNRTGTNGKGVQKHGHAVN